MNISLADNNRYVLLSRYCGTFSNSTRIAILEKLAANKHCMKGDFMEIPGISRFTVGQNLKDLRKYGLVNGTFTSKNITYCINYEKLEEFKQLFDNFYNALIKNRASVNPTNKDCAASSNK